MASSIAQQFIGLPMEDLIGGPLIAVAEANGRMAQTQTQFILDTCFTKDTTKGKEDEPYKAIMVCMTLDRGVLSFNDKGEPQTTTISSTIRLPILTILPLNTLGVDSASVNFEMEVKSASSEDIKEDYKKTTSAQASLEASARLFHFIPISISGSVSYSSEDSRTHDTHYENSNTAKYTVNVHAGQLPMPKGVNVIIDAFSKSIEPIEVPASNPTKG